MILIYLFSSGTTKHSIDQSQSDYYKNELKNKDVKKTSLLRRIRNEIYYLGTSMVNLLHFLKGKNSRNHFIIEKSEIETIN